MSFETVTSFGFRFAFFLRVCEGEAGSSIIIPWPLAAGYIGAGSFVLGDFALAIVFAKVAAVGSRATRVR